MSYSALNVKFVKVTLRFYCEFVVKEPLLRQQIPGHQATECNGEIVKTAATFCLISLLRLITRSLKPGARQAKLACVASRSIDFPQSPVQSRESTRRRRTVNRVAKAFGRGVVTEIHSSVTGCKNVSRHAWRA